MAFHKSSLIVAWYTFTSIKIRTLTPNRFENQAMTNSNYLATIAITNKGVLNEKLLLSIVAVLTWIYLNTFILIAILGEYSR